jgi:hypothetical protein
MTDSILPIGMDPKQIRERFSREDGQNKAEMSVEGFSQLMWQTVVKETLTFEGLGGSEGGGLGSGMYSDWAKEGFSSAIAAQLAKVQPLPISPSAGVVTTQEKQDNE